MMAIQYRRVKLGKCEELPGNAPLASAEQMAKFKNGDTVPKELWIRVIHSTKCDNATCDRAPGSTRMVIRDGSCKNTTDCFVVDSIAQRALLLNTVFPWKDRAKYKIPSQYWDTEAAQCICQLEDDHDKERAEKLEDAFRRSMSKNRLKELDEIVISDDEADEAEYEASEEEACKSKKPRQTTLTAKVNSAHRGQKRPRRKKAPVTASNDSASILLKLQEQLDVLNSKFNALENPRKARKLSDEKVPIQLDSDDGGNEGSTGGRTREKTQLTLQWPPLSTPGTNPTAPGGPTPPVRPCRTIPVTITGSPVVRATLPPRTFPSAMKSMSLAQQYNDRAKFPLPSPRDHKAGSGSDSDGGDSNDSGSDDDETSTAKDVSFARDSILHWMAPAAYPRNVTTGNMLTSLHAALTTNSIDFQSICKLTESNSTSKLRIFGDTLSTAEQLTTALATETHPDHAVAMSLLECVLFFKRIGFFTGPQSTWTSGAEQGSTPDNGPPVPSLSTQPAQYSSVSHLSGGSDWLSTGLPTGFD